jgi:hypothetical protein|tara:strand:+ start:119 stop:322 length:204 start_codon:yes stop_codon:yes gene_type:complete
MENQIKPPSWENRNAKAKRLNKLLKDGQKVSRWELFPVRFICLDMAQGNEELLHEINLLIDEAKASL